MRGGARRALVLHVERKSGPLAQLDRTAGSRLDEAVALTAAIGLDVVHSLVAPLVRPVPATLIGSGKVEEIKHLVHDAAPEVVIVNASLSPVQQRNLEREWAVKVLDRTGLILEIFGERAQTREGRLQVELAHLNYQRSRLVRSWTHLERQRGGFGFLGGPGESQIETDRRLIGERIARIKKELTEVTRTRGLHRKARKRVPYPIVALVGYTNAGKSTLFNRLTDAEVLAKDMLFATLDPTMRALKLPSGRNIILSDTVGFIADLPTQLVAAFRATLEEVLEADIILHIRDIAHDETAAQKSDVLKVLKDLGIGTEGGKTESRPIVEVLNKLDLLDPEIRDGLLTRSRLRPTEGIAVSALTGEGLDALFQLLDTQLGNLERQIEIAIPMAEGANVAWAYRHGRVVERRDTETGTVLTLAVDPAALESFLAHFGDELVIIPQNHELRMIS